MVLVVVCRRSKAPSKSRRKVRNVELGHFTQESGVNSHWLRHWVRVLARSPKCPTLLGEQSLPGLSIQVLVIDVSDKKPEARLQSSSHLNPSTTSPPYVRSSAKSDKMARRPARCYRYCKNKVRIPLRRRRAVFGHFCAGWGTWTQVMGMDREAGRGRAGFWTWVYIGMLTCRVSLAVS
jgi:hypothetical protein